MATKSNVVTPKDFPLPGGVYTLDVLRATHKLSAKQTPMIVIECEISAPESITTPEGMTVALQGTRLTFYAMLDTTPAKFDGRPPIDKVFDLYERLGAKQESIDENKPPLEVFKDLRVLAFLSGREKFHQGPDKKPLISPSTKKPMSAGFEINTDIANILEKVQVSVPFSM